MDPVSELVRAYKHEQAPRTADGEDLRKIDIVRRLAEIPDRRVLSFFLQIVADEDESDLARIEILKLLQQPAINGWDRSGVAVLVARVLLRGADLDIRNYAAIWRWARFP